MDDIPKDPNVLKPAVTTPLEPVSPNSGWVKEEPPPTPDVPPVQNPPKEIFSPLTESRPDQPTPGSPTQEVPSSPSPQSPGLSSQTLIQTHPPSGGRGFRTFVILGSFVILGIWAGAGYLYMQNQNLKGQSQETANAQVSPALSPTPVFSPEQVKIKSGSVVLEKPDGTTQTLMDKESYESTGITGFLKVTVSLNSAGTLTVKVYFSKTPSVIAVSAERTEGELLRLFVKVEPSSKVRP